MSYHPDVYLSPSQKHRLIDDLSHENNELRHRAVDNRILHDRILDSERRSAVLRDDRDRLGAEMSRRAEADNSTINALNRDIVESRNELHDKDAFLAKLKAELQDLITAADAKTSDIARMSADLAGKTELGA